MDGDENKFEFTKKVRAQLLGNKLLMFDLAEDYEYGEANDHDAEYKGCFDMS